MITPKTITPTPAEGRLAYKLVTERDRGLCQRCLRNCGPVARDHRRNRSQGGQTTTENLQLLGLKCHEWKTDHPVDAMREGWAVPGHANPAETPAARWFPTERGTMRLGWCLYGPGVAVTEISAAEAAALRYRAGVI